MPEHTDLSPKTAKKQKNILTNALKVFAKEGYRNTDVQVIADLAGVGKGTVYRHFGNKEQLFLATSRFCMERMSEYVRQQVVESKQIPELVEEHGVPELLRRTMRASAEFYQQHPQAIEIMIQERAEFRESVYPTHLMFREEKRAGFDAIIEAGIERGELRPTGVKEASDAFSDLLFGCLISGCLQGQRTKLVERVEHAIELLFMGLVMSESSASSKPARGTSP